MLAKTLSMLVPAGLDFSFFCNSGTEAVEGALKLARAFNPAKQTIVAATKGFHGKSYGALSASAKAEFRRPFGPMLPNIEHVPFNDLLALRDMMTSCRAVGEDVGAVLLEPIQGEGGVNIPDDNYLPGVRALCDEFGALFILDEVQTGMGRTGKLFAWQHVGVKPDIMTLAKALGGGLPIGAMIAKSEIAQSLTPGSHGSTFGGNPVSCAAALAVLDALEQDGVIENATSVGGYLLERLRAFARDCPRVAEVRGLGMMIGIVLHGEAKSAADACRRERLLVNATAENVLRLLPPLTLTRDEADAGLKIIERALSATPVSASAAEPTATR
jgi:acetylornithine/succinyldiaminopimelate/putrescine aminotransferase